MRRTSAMASSLPCSSPARNSAMAPRARTKLIFDYSDEDESTTPNHSHRGGGGGCGGGTRVVTVEGGVPDADTLAELRAEAEVAERAREEREGARRQVAAADASELPGMPPLAGAGEDSGCFEFMEDLVASASTSVPVRGTDGMRVRIVEAHGLRDPALARGTGLRVGLTPEELAAFRRLGGLKRFRDAGSDGSDEPGGAELAVEAAEPRLTGVLESKEEDSLPEATAGTVRAVRSHGYVLSVDERDLMDADGWGSAVDRGNEGDSVGEADATADMADMHESAVLDESAVEDDADGGFEGVDGMDDDEDEEDDDDEEDEELNDALFVAIVEQLVRCCAAEDLDEAMSREAARFLSEARPALKELEEGVINEHVFANRLDYSVRRFQRIFKAVYRPHDEPIVIDGVKLDI